MDVPQTTKKIEKVAYGGLEAYTDAYALYESEIMFLSLFGNKTAVRGIWSSLVSGRWIDLLRESGDQIFARGDNQWRICFKNLPSGIAQAMLIPRQLNLKRVKDEFVVIGHSGKRLRESFFLYLNKVSRIPLKKEWTDWLFRQAGREDMLTELTTLNLTALYYQGSDDWLANVVTRGIKEKVIY